MSTFYYVFPFAALLGAAAVALASDPPKLRWLAAALRLSRGRHIKRGLLHQRLASAYRVGVAWLVEYAGRGPVEAAGIEIVRPVQPTPAPVRVPVAAITAQPFDPLTGRIPGLFLGEVLVPGELPVPDRGDLMRSGVTDYSRADAARLLEMLSDERVGAAA